MATIADRILQYLQQHPEGADDDQLCDALYLKWRQQANLRCRTMAKKGLLLRVKADGEKIRNYPLGDAVPEAIQNGEPLQVADPNEPWFWEGNVQEAVRVYLEPKGYRIVRMANPKTHQTGEDIVAESEDGALLVTAKGYPKGTKKTHPSVQAGHWFKGALFDVVAWRGKDQNADIAVALPDFKRYRALAEQASWLQSVASFSFFWVGQDGEVEEVTFRAGEMSIRTPLQSPEEERLTQCGTIAPYA